MVNITRFSKANTSVEFEVQEGHDVVLRRGWEMRDGERCQIGGVLTLDEAREEQVRLVCDGYRAVSLE